MESASCRAEALQILAPVLASGASVFSFDFAGCGHSEGDYISLGWHEKDDLATALAHLREISPPFDCPPDASGCLGGGWAAPHHARRAVWDHAGDNTNSGLASPCSSAAPRSRPESYVRVLFRLGNRQQIR